MSNGPETPLVMVDVVIFSQEDRDVLLIRRNKDPYEGLWALPGGFVEVGEKLEDAAARIAKDEAGLDVEDVRLVGVYSDPDRDPRGHNISCTFFAAGWSGEPSPGSDAAEIAFVDPSEAEIGFDHEKIISDAHSLVS
jgi:8-oxo-dGTP diphosphatase